MATRNERKRKAKAKRLELDQQFREAMVNALRNQQVRSNLSNSKRDFASEGYVSSVVLVASGRQHGGRAQAKWGFSDKDKRRIEKKPR